ncbi:uncharacterized protein LOC135330985 [Halichondria panicea]|uniref:uncharacterized protein LOC135330985 n=1 Tax=Halichondria panicea TaxID=6063 RepID=UPI00312B383C
MVFTQVGSGNKGALYTLLGCFSGALIYGVLEPTLRKWFTKLVEQKQTVWVDEMAGVSYLAAALPFAVALVGGLVLTELYVPPNKLALPAVSHPVIGGLIMGSLQLLIGFTVEDSLGGSSSYCTILSRLGLSSLIPYFENFRTGFANWWQVIYWLGAVSAAALTSYATGTWARGDPITPGMGLIGGFMMVFGARLASGCTSGHGLSGMALLSFSSFVAVAAMFAGGIGLENAVRLLHS